MKKIYLFASAALLLLAGCAKETQGVTDAGEGQVSVSVTAGLLDASTKAVSDYDGNAKQVNHWIMEVRDSDGNLFSREERKDVTAGTLTQTFTVTLYKGNDYTFQFWADTYGQYKTDDLTAIQPVTLVANADSRDAFSTNVAYTCTKSESISATLYRPFAQLNIQTTDLQDLWETTGGETDRTEYDSFTPQDFSLTATVPTQFNVKTQAASNEQLVNLSADDVYVAYKSDKTTPEENNNYYNHVNPATLFMDYIFAGAEKSVVDLNFAFAMKGKDVSLDFAAIPLQRNYRTNIKGSLLSNTVQWVVTIDPEWETPDYDVPYLEASTIEEAQSYVAPASQGTQEAKVVKVQDGAVQATDVKDNDTYGKVVEFVLKQYSPKQVSFQLPAITVDNTASWLVTYEDGYPTENVSVDAPEGTKVIIEAPTSHVEVTGTSYKQIIASTSTNSLVIPFGCAVDKLIIKEGGLEIHGTVNEVSVEGTTDNVFVRACEGLSVSVYNVLKDYIAKGYEGVAQGTTPETYNIVLSDGADWTYYAAKSFSQMDESAKTITILSEAEFALLSKDVDEGNTYEGWTITLGNNLDMSAHNWLPIGRFSPDEKAFKGTFDGANLPIKGITVNTEDRKGNGVFGKVYAPCVLKNINIVDAVVTAEGTNTYTGGLVGHGYATIENCSFQGTVNGGNQMGGIAASGGFTIKNCTFDGTINGKYWALGGIIGNCQDGGEISGNTATGSIVGVLADCTDPFIGGGIIGCAIYTSYDVKNNYSAMNITFNGEAQTGFPIAGVYNIDKPGTGTTDFSNLLTKVADNTWDKSIFTEEEYEIYYNTDAPASTGYMLNYGTTSTKVK